MDIIVSTLTKAEQDIEAKESTLCRLKLAQVPNIDADSLWIISSILYVLRGWECYASND